MQYINKIEIQGIVGSIRSNTLFNDTVYSMSVETTTMYRSKETQQPIAETMWHIVVVWASTTSTDLSKVEKGTPVRVVGRLRTTKYTDPNGIERMYNEVIAGEFEIIAND
jgi:single-strand DNA-binding protein